MNMLRNNTVVILNREMANIGKIIQRGRNKGGSEIEPFLVGSTTFKRISEIWLGRLGRGVVLLAIFIVFNDSLIDIKQYSMKVAFNRKDSEL